MKKLKGYDLNTLSDTEEDSKNLSNSLIINEEEKNENQNNYKINKIHKVGVMSDESESEMSINNEIPLES